MTIPVANIEPATITTIASTIRSPVTRTFIRSSGALVQLNGSALSGRRPALASAPAGHGGPPKRLVRHLGCPQRAPNLFSEARSLLETGIRRAVPIDHPPVTLVAWDEVQLPVC